jgi:hypothetical protein
MKEEPPVKIQTDKSRKYFGVVGQNITRDKNRPVTIRQKQEKRRAIPCSPLASMLQRCWASGQPSFSFGRPPSPAQTD